MAPVLTTQERDDLPSIIGVLDPDDECHRGTRDQFSGIGGRSHAGFSISSRLHVRSRLVRVAGHHRGASGSPGSNSYGGFQPGNCLTRSSQRAMAGNCSPIG
jgi:hypothetical protein